MIRGIEERELFASGHRGCAGCGEALAVRHILKAAGKNTIAVSSTGCMEIISSPYPQSAWLVPWIHGAFENAPAIASGVDEALKFRGRRKGYNIVVLAGDGAAFDIGLQSLSGAIERGQDLLFVCTDNEAYANTGMQRSSATPIFASTATTPAGKKIHGKLQPKKPLPFIIASHGVRYVASASVSNLNDLNRKVKKALAVPGVSFLHVLCPCPPGWKHGSDETIEMARLAVAADVFPLYEIEDGCVTLQANESRRPVKEYLERQGRFSHLSEQETERIQAFVVDRKRFLEELAAKGRVFDVLY